MMKKVCCTILCVCLLATLIGCGSTGAEDETESATITTVAGDGEYTPVNEGALWGTEYDGYVVEVLGFTYEDDWEGCGMPTVCIEFYYENGNADPLYLLESFAISVYQDDVEQEYIGLDYDNEDAQNAAVSVKDGAGIYCLMVYSLTSDSKAELWITEPTADADLLVKMYLTESGEEEVEETTTAKEYSYNVVVYSDSYVEITLKSVTTKNAYFSITNVSDQALQISAEYIQLDGVEYTYEDTNYSTPILYIESGGTEEYKFCDYDLGNEVDFEIANPGFEVFSGSFEILDEDGTSLEYAGITDVSVK